MSDVQETVREFLSALGASHKDVVEKDIAGQKIYNIETDGSVLVGMYGDTVHAIDYLVKRIIEKRAGVAEAGGERSLFLVDVNGYRSRKILDLQTKALVLAERARSFQYDVELTPMSAYERLIIHSALAGAPNIKTESQGEGRARRVVIRYTP
ncbi:MAG TPA: R3H domain-containing nucleic acid-binding protein [Candidatus Paceibacterota bacterium]